MQSSGYEQASVLFICTHNSARSQMAEGLLRARCGDRFEIGIDISDHYSKTVDEVGDRSFDYVVTACESARENCLYLPARKKNLHQSFEDPSAATGTDEEKLAVFRRVRDAIADWIDERLVPETTAARR